MIYDLCSAYIVQIVDVWFYDRITQYFRRAMSLHDGNREAYNAEWFCVE